MSFAALTAATPAARARAVAPALFAVALGVAMVWLMGFANADTLHTVAHDGRHAFAFPCH